MHFVCWDSILKRKKLKAHIWNTCESLGIDNISVSVLNILTNKVYGYEIMKENVFVGKKWQHI